MWPFENEKETFVNYFLFELITNRLQGVVAADGDESKAFGNHRDSSG